MRLHHKSKITSKRNRKLIKKTTSSAKNNRTRAALTISDLISPDNLNQLSIAITIGSPIVACGYNKLNNYFKRHNSPLITKCNFILKAPKNKICGANAEILQTDYKGRQTIIHRCSEFSAHVIAIADTRYIKRLQAKGEYRK